MRDNSSATVMLGLEGMAVLAVSERDGEVEYAIETTATSGWCPVCGAQARLHDQRPTWVRDLPAGDRPVTLVWVKRIWRCVHPECEQQTWTETHAAHSTVFATGVVDLDHARLIDIFPGRSRKVLADWLSAQPSEWTASIGVAALDPFRGYGNALSTGLPHAVRVLDPFHVVRLGFAAVDDVRRRVQQDIYGHRGRRGDPLYGIRRVLRRGADNLTPTAWARLLAGIEARDDRSQVAAAWVAAQKLRAIYRAIAVEQAAARLYD
ncbi:ISL3 family transposase [Mycobacterium sp. SM1]|uniref:transposase n=1 Tax=Mycobacterium sp. SM1 TaxID=2816243 RepID=UPI001BCC4709|nr:transposase [Mycobacterium sp. SM1]MBS4728261.1 ISL3 family transposase [Mycobacterium sp. SM1]